MIAINAFTNVSIGESFGLSVLGMFVVFLVLVFLMIVIYIMTAIIRKLSVKSVAATASATDPSAPEASVPAVQAPAEPAAAPIPVTEIIESKKYRVIVNGREYEVGADICDIVSDPGSKEVK